jgi:hypothetical protein
LRSLEDIIRSLIRHLLNVATLNNRRKSIRQLPHHGLGQIVSADSRNITIAHAVFGDEHIVAQSCSITSSCTHTDVCLRSTKSAIWPHHLNSNVQSSLKDSPYTQPTQPSPHSHPPKIPANPSPQTHSDVSSQSPSPHPSAAAPQTPPPISSRG